jgi:exodeoxyribonuclease (lambda-induced)
MIDTIIRPGKITASRALEFMTKGRGKDKPFGETALSYAKELAMVRLGHKYDHLTTYAMEWGIEWEPEARKVYENSRGKTKDPCFIEFGEHAGATPDAFVGEDGLLEIKCPQEKAHTSYLIDGPPKQYIYQMQFQLMVTGSKWCDFMTFHPHFPDGLKANVFRIERDEELIEQMIDRIEPFVELVQGYVSKLKAL